MFSKKLKLLVVDDEKDICSFVKLLFRKRGFSVFSALTGRQAISTAKKIRPHIALIDIHLKKGIDGLEVLRQIKEFLLGCRCIIVTWDSAKEKIRKAKSLGVVSYLTKPLTIKQLIDSVNRAIKDIRKRGTANG